jgi:hypothetical protein
MAKKLNFWFEAILAKLPRLSLVCIFKLKSFEQQIRYQLFFLKTLLLTDQSFRFKPILRLFKQCFKS